MQYFALRRIAESAGVFQRGSRLRDSGMGSDAES